MNTNQSASNRVLICAILLSGFGAAHLIDDFLYGIPADFGFSNEFSQFLAIIYFALTGWLIALSARGKKQAYLANIFLGIFLVAADMTKHTQEGLLAGPWRSGVISRIYAFGVVATALALIVTSFIAWRSAKTT